MPPTPGKIHNLPVRVSYTIDNSPQSYFTLLSDRQKVYVHPKPSSTQPGPSSSSTARGTSRPSTRKRPNDSHHISSEGAQEEAGSVVGIGSCVLKGVVWGVCYASPECVPSPSIHDFSVYASDPTSTPPSRTEQEVQERWDGKGFLSWALYEPSEGTTLIRGKIIYDPEAFESVSFEGGGGGGLEGLMALAAAEDGGNGEQGWGLEVLLSLKMVDLGGKGVGDKKEFGEMIASAQNGSGSGSGSGAGGRMPILAQPRPVPPTILEAGEKRTVGVGPRRIEPRLVAPDSGGKGSSNFGNGNTHQPLVRSLAGPGPGPARANLSIPTSLPDRSKPSSSSSSSLPPSSIPMAQTSSSEIQTQNQRMMPPPPPSPPHPTRLRTSSTSTSGPIPRSSSTTPTPTALATNALISHLTPPSTAQQSTRDDREITPPPLTGNRSPPPSTPARLQAILRSDAKLSPGLAKSLANNPTLLRLLKNVPASSIPLSALSGLKSPFGGGGGGGKSPSIGGKVDPANPFGPPPAFIGSSPNNNNNNNKPSPATSGSHFDTPDNTTVVAGPSRTTTLTKSTSGQIGQGPIRRECNNCHTTQSSMWRSKKSKSGEVLSVCDECGLYFNKNKVMRPVPDLAGEGGDGEGEGEKVDGKGKGKGKAKTPISTNKNQPPPQTSGNKRKYEPQPPSQQQGIRSSPRRPTRVQHPQNPPSPPPKQPESPIRKRKKTVNPPLPSPRRNTRAAAKELNLDHFQGQGPGSGPSGSGLNNDQIGGRVNDAFSPISLFGSNGNGQVGDGGEDEIEAFLKQFASDDHGDQQPIGNNGNNGPGNGDGDGENGVDLDQWFKEVGIDMGVVDDQQ